MSSFQTQTSTSGVLPTCAVLDAFLHHSKPGPPSPQHCKPLTPLTPILRHLEPNMPAVLQRSWRTFRSYLLESQTPQGLPSCSYIVTIRQVDPIGTKLLTKFQGAHVTIADGPANGSPSGEARDLESFQSSPGLERKLTHQGYVMDTLYMLERSLRSTCHLT